MAKAPGNTKPSGKSKPTGKSLPRVAAARVLHRVLREGAYTQLAIHGALTRGAPLSPPDRGLLTELVYGTLRHLPLIDAALQQACKRPLKKVDEAVLDVLRVGAYEALHLGTDDHAAVNEAVNAARTLRGDGAGGFSNGVLRGLLRLRDAGTLMPAADASLDGVVTRTGLPRWLAQDLTAQLGLAGAEAFGAQALGRGQVHACVPAAPERDGAATALAAAGLVSTPHPWVDTALVLEGGSGNVEDLATRAGGRVYVQNAASQAVAAWAARTAASVGSAPGPVLDLCSAPGGKTTLMRARGLRVVAADVHPGKLALAQAQWKRLGLPQDAVAMDGRRPAFAQGCMALVLLDAPCTGTGLLSRRPEIKLRRTEEDVRRLCNLQVELLDSAAVLVRAGGHLLYSVCSVTRAEGRAQVEAFLRRNDAFTLVPADGTFPVDGVKDGMVTLWPHLHGTDGFFAALMKRAR